MEYITFKEALFIEDFKVIVSRITQDCNWYINNSFYLHFISDGRSPRDNSFCFIEDENKVIKLKNVIYITSKVIKGISCVVCKDPRSLFIKVLELIKNEELTYNHYINNKEGLIDSTVKIHSTAVIEDEVKLGKNTVISAGCVIKKGVLIGDHCIIRENTVIGCDGIALYKDTEGDVLRFPHLSGVIVGNNVEIGSNCVIAKGTLKPTKIANDVVIGNLCNIGHGVSIADKVWISVGSLVGGNSQLEAYSSLGMGVRIKDNTIISANSSIGMGTVLTKNTENNSSYFGNPGKKIRKIKVGPDR